MNTADLPASDLVRLTTSGGTSAKEAVEASLDRIAKRDPGLNAFSVVLADQARAEAARLDTLLADGGQPGPLHGVPVAIKEELDVAGCVTTFGGIANSTPASADGEVVRRLRQAGAVVIGKTRMPEFGQWPFTESVAGGITRNPWDRSHTPGGSSGGTAAAVAAGMVPVGIGGDGGGSIRIPSACCGTTGFKPTHGLVSLDGCFPLAPTWDHAGPMARDVQTCAELMGALVAGFEPAALHDLTDVRVAVAWTELADPLVRERVEAAAAHFPHATRIDLPLSHDTGALFGREVAEVHRELWRDHPDQYSDNVAHKMIQAMLTTDAEADAARAVRENYREEWARLTTDVDLVLTPTLAMVAPPAALGEEPIRNRMLQFTYPFNALGAPALALPCGAAEDGLPASVQVAGRPGDDGLVLAAGALLQRALSGRS
jgi:amidase